jgi:DNA polymerase
MLVGEAPGEEEDRQGLPFVGVTGTRFFWPLLRDAGFDPGELFITSAVKCRPPGNRDPRSLELAACRQRWLEDQVRAADPLVVVLLGRMAAIQALGRVNSLAGVRGRVLEVYGRPGLVTYHPTAGMRFPDRGRAMREDFRRLRDMVDQKPEKQD